MKPVNLPHDIPYKKLQRLRSIIAQSILDPTKCFSYDPLLCYVIEPFMYITNGGWKCLKCRRFLKTYNEAYQHLVQDHKEELTFLAYKYVYEKWKYIGIIKE